MSEERLFNNQSKSEIPCSSINFFLPSWLAGWLIKKNLKKSSSKQRTQKPNTVDCCAWLNIFSFFFFETTTFRSVIFYGERGNFSTIISVCNPIPFFSRLKFLLSISRRERRLFKDVSAASITPYDSTTIFLLFIFLFETSLRFVFPTECFWWFFVFFLFDENRRLFQWGRNA